MIDHIIPNVPSPLCLWIRCEIELFYWIYLLWRLRSRCCKVNCCSVHQKTKTNLHRTRFRADFFDACFFDQYKCIYRWHHNDVEVICLFLFVFQYGSDEFGHDSPSRYASPKGAGAGAAYQDPYYAGGEWGAGYYQPPPPYQHDPYATSPGEIIFCFFFF